MKVAPWVASRKKTRKKGVGRGRDVLNEGFGMNECVPGLQLRNWLVRVDYY